MAICFHCGCEFRGNAFQRTVKTGTSHSRGRNVTYWGTRSLCAGCAQAHDQAARIKIFVILAFVVGVLILLLIHG
jgi:hypothetical protein